MQGEPAARILESANNSYNGRSRWLIGIIAVPAYALIAWALLTTVTNQTAIVGHDKDVSAVRNEIAFTKADSAKDVVTIRGELSAMRAEMASQQQGIRINQNKIETFIQSSQSETRNSIANLSAILTDLRIRLGDASK